MPNNSAFTRRYIDLFRDVNIILDYDFDRVSSHIFTLPDPEPETHRCYAAVDTVHGTKRIPVSDALPGNGAWDVFEELERDPRTNGKDRRFTNGRFAPARRRITTPGYTINGWPVRHFAVRCTTDPDWPAYEQTQTARSLI